jgi:hypothetical protein
VSVVAFAWCPRRRRTQANAVQCNWEREGVGLSQVKFWQESMHFLARQDILLLPFIFRLIWTKNIFRFHDILVVLPEWDVDQRWETGGASDVQRAGGRAQLCPQDGASYRQVSGQGPRRLID